MVLLTPVVLFLWVFILHDLHPCSQWLIQGWASHLNQANKHFLPQFCFNVVKSPWVVNLWDSSMDPPWPCPCCIQKDNLQEERMAWISGRRRDRQGQCGSFQFLLLQFPESNCNPVLSSGHRGLTGKLTLRSQKKKIEIHSSPSEET